MFELQKRENISVRKWYRVKDQIWFDPPYQRQGDIWNLSKKQMLIDTIVNNFDIPKFYFHDLLFKRISEKKMIDDSFRFAVIDGKQRLAIIYSFMDDDFSLSEDFEYLRDPEKSNDLRGKKYSEIKKSHPEIIEDFDTYVIDVVYVFTDEEEKIEELFLRLNEGAPLNSQEKRAARSIEYSKIIKTLERTIKMTEIVNFTNKRGVHEELLTKVLLLEKNKGIVDLKKTYLDSFVDDVRLNPASIKKLSEDAMKTFKKMKKVFTGENKIKARGIFPVYYWVCKEHSEEELKKFKKFITAFDKDLKKNRDWAKDEKTIHKVDSTLHEFNRLNQQGTNDAGSILRRLQIINSYFKKWKKEI